MTPSARLSSVIELLDTIMSEAGPAEHVVRNYFRTRRYAGSKDRRWVTEFVYALFRHLGEIDWMATELGLPLNSRTRALIALFSIEKTPLADIQERFLSGSYAIEALSGDEVAALEKAGQLDPSDMPVAAKGNFPDWLADELVLQYADRAADVMASYLERAPLTLRVNPLQSDREEVLRILTEEGADVKPTDLSPYGIIVETRMNLAGHAVMEQGLVEIQDEAAQVSSLLADARPGMQVTDFCAGAGGKSLAMASEMKNAGHIYALDVNARRMKDMSIRAKRAHVDILHAYTLKQDERDEEIFTKLNEQMDRVFVDAPCSGSGTWRRQPDQKWFFTQERLTELVALQQEILQKASTLVAPGGRLIYATCSILKQENAEQVSEFLAKNTDFSILPVSEFWSDVGLSGDYDGEFLTLSPDDKGTDGFFTAVLSRSA